MSIDIRKAIVDDFPKIHSMIMDFAHFIQTPEKVSVSVDRMIQEKDFFNCLVAVESGEIVGFATYFLAYYSWTGKSLYLDDLYVSENFRGNNIGTQLFDAVLAIADQEGCAKLRWQVSKWNDRAISFYKKRGTVIDDVEINCDLFLPFSN